MLAGVSELCFGASYAIALVLEILRLFLRVSVRSGVMFAIVMAGMIAHSAFLMYRLQQMAPNALLNWYLGCILLSWVVALHYLFVFALTRRPIAGLLLLPTSLTMIVLAHVFPQSDEAVKVWNVVHGFSLAIGMASVVIGFMAGLLYLVQSYRLKHKVPVDSRAWLPSLERLQHINERCLLASVGLLGFGLVSGVLLNLKRRGSEHAIPWSDPVVVASVVWLAWLLAVLLFHAFYRPARQGRKIAYMTIASFGFLGIVLSVMRWMPSHQSLESTTVAPAQASQNDVPRATALDVSALDSSARQAAIVQGGDA